MDNGSFENFSSHYISKSIESYSFNIQSSQRNQAVSFALFRSIPDITANVLIPPQWSYVQENFNRNIDKTVNYYQFAQLPIRAGHILARLIATINVPKNLPLERYYDNVESVAIEQASILGYATPLKFGRLFSGMFYDVESPEYIIAVDDFFNIEETAKNWRQARPLYPILHPKSDLNVQFCNAKHYSNETGLSVLVLNVPMLMVQYRAYLKEVYSKGYMGMRGNLYNFLGGFVIPNMMRQHMDLCLFNRIILRHDAPEVEPDNKPLLKHAFNLPNMNEFVDTNIDVILKNLKQVPGRFELLLKAIPSFSGESIYKSLLVPDVMPTKQIEWLMSVSRLKYLDFLMRLSGNHVETKNQLTINQCARNLRLYDTLLEIRDHLPGTLYGEIQTYIENLNSHTAINLEV